VDDSRAVDTGRLKLRSISLKDVGALFTILSDPAGWWYDPTSRHADLETTRDFVGRAAARWERDGLSYWTVRGLEGNVIGLGGAQRHRTGCWNLFYRLDVGAWSRGYATELGRATLAAANEHDASVPCVAFIAEHNAPSRRVASRLGLTDFGLRVDGNDGELRLAYADRVLENRFGARPKHNGPATAAAERGNYRS
jgi:RimJ/RimL family protein N-acetyltransferase